MTESIQAQDTAYMGKGRLGCPESSVINESAFYRIDLSFHLLGEGLRFCSSLYLKKVHLPDFGLSGFLRHFALSSHTRQSVFRPRNLIARYPFTMHIAAISVKSFSRRTDAKSLVLADREIPVRPVQVRCAVILLPLFSGPLFILIYIRQTGDLFFETVYQLCMRQYLLPLPSACSSRYDIRCPLRASPSRTRLLHCRSL